MVQGAEAAVGAQLGPYRLLAELGAGGMGTVFLAEGAGKAPDLAPGERVALKLVHSHLNDGKTSLKRFLREVEVGKAVRHPNVVRTLDAGVYADAWKYQHYLVMEYVEGQTLRELVKELGRVPEALCRHIGLEMAKGLEAIHAAGGGAPGRGLRRNAGNDASSAAGTAHDRKHSIPSRASVLKGPRRPSKHVTKYL